MKYEITNLGNELRAAGIAFSGCDSDGVVWSVDETEQIQTRADVAAVLAKHDPKPKEKQTLIMLLEDIDKRLAKLEK